MHKEKLVSKLNEMHELSKVIHLEYDMIKVNQYLDIREEIINSFDRPYVGVGVIMFNGKAGNPLQILMENRKNPYNHGNGEWSLPGGWMEKGETWESAALREAYEEVGVKAERARFITAVTTHFKERDFSCVTGFVALSNWYVDPEFKEPLPFAREPEKVNELKWINIVDVGNLNLFAASTEILKLLNSVHYNFQGPEIFPDTTPRDK